MKDQRARELKRPIPVPSRPLSKEGGGPRMRTRAGANGKTPHFHPTSSHGRSSSDLPQGTAVVIQEDRGPRVSFIPLLE